MQVTKVWWDGDKMMAEPIDPTTIYQEPAQQKPVALKWQQAPFHTAWGDEMVVARVAIDKDHILSLYCERDQTSKVEAIFAQRTWVGLTDYERTLIRKEVGYNQFMTAGEYAELVQKATESILKAKNQ